MSSALQTPSKTIIFESAREELRLVKKAQTVVRGAEGQQVDIRPGETLLFRHHRLSVPIEGRITLADGQVVDSGPVLDWLRGHGANGDRREGFWEAEVVVPEISEEEIARLTELAVAGDREGLAALVAEEEAGFGREKLLKVAREHLERLEAPSEPPKGSGPPKTA
jgi:hypothetical protein